MLTTGHNKLFHRKYITTSLSITSIIIVLYFSYMLSTGFTLDVKHWLDISDHWLALVSISFLLMFICALTPLPAEAVTIANGAIFGPLLGALVTWLSAMVGAYITFIWSRTFLNKLNINVYNSQNFHRVSCWINKWGLYGFLLARLIPLVPFFTLNIGAALLPLSRRNYILITGIAILPHILIICCLGDYFGNHLSH